MEGSNIPFSFYCSGDEENMLASLRGGFADDYKIWKFRLDFDYYKLTVMTCVGWLAYSDVVSHFCYFGEELEMR